MSYQQSPVMGAAAAAPPAGVQMRTVRFGRDPVHCICPNCRQQVVTRVDYVRTHHLSNGIFNSVL